MSSRPSATRVLVEDKNGVLRKLCTIDDLFDKQQHEIRFLFGNSFPVRRFDDGTYKTCTDLHISVHLDSNKGDGVIKMTMFYDGKKNKGQDKRDFYVLEKLPEAEHFLRIIFPPVERLPQHKKIGRDSDWIIPFGVWDDFFFYKPIRD